jgi:hypothetical protein
MRNFILGVVVGLALSLGAMANAGVLTHVAAYEIGKHAGRKQAGDCPCPVGGVPGKALSPAATPAAPEARPPAPPAPAATR